MDALGPVVQRGTPAAVMSSSRPGNSFSNSIAPRAISRCRCRSCGTVARLAGAAGNSSRSQTVTAEYDSDSTRAAHRPAMLPPMTSACSRAFALPSGICGDYPVL